MGIFSNLFSKRMEFEELSKICESIARDFMITRNEWFPLCIKALTTKEAQTRSGKEVEKNMFSWIKEDKKQARIEIISQDLAGIEKNVKAYQLIIARFAGFPIITGSKGSLPLVTRQKPYVSGKDKKLFQHMLTRLVGGSEEAKVYELTLYYALVYQQARNSRQNPDIAVYLQFSDDVATYLSGQKDLYALISSTIPILENRTTIDVAHNFGDEEMVYCCTMFLKNEMGEISEDEFVQPSKMSQAQKKRLRDLR